MGFFLAGLILSRLVLRASQDETHGVRCDSSSKRPFWGHDQMPGFLVICFSSGWSQPQGSLQCVTSEISTPLLPPPPTPWLLLLCATHRGLCCVARLRALGRAVWRTRVSGLSVWALLCCAAWGLIFPLWFCAGAQSSCNIPLWKEGQRSV